MPRPVLEAVIDSLTHGAEYPTDDVPRWGYETLEAERTEMAEFLGCAKEELAFTHNCTEAMSIIANGLDLRVGDEVLLTNQEHGSGTAPWRLKAARVGVSVREVEIPVTPRQPEELTDRLISAIGPKTRVISFSGITSPTGLSLMRFTWCNGGLISSVKSTRSSSWTVWRSKGGGLIGNGCVGDVFSPGTSGRGSEQGAHLTR